jgi:Trk K+ transport system NAD-binding subunit
VEHCYAWCPPVGRFGRFGKAVQEYITGEGVQTRLIEADTGATGAPLDAIEGRGTEANTLVEAGIKDAAGIIAGTDSDTNNLSILITARDLNPGLFTVVRQNHQNKDPIFKAADIDIIMQPGAIAAQHILGLILAPLLGDFLKLANDQDEEWANVLVSRVAGVVEDVTPESWDLEISPLSAPAIFDCLIRGDKICLRDICAHPQNRDEQLPCVPLLIKRGNEKLLLPDMEAQLKAGDQIVFCGREEAMRQARHTANDPQVLYYIRTGIDRPSGALWRWLTND